MMMKSKFFLAAFFSLFYYNLFAQEVWQDAVYLKSGSIIKGTIIEQIPNKSLKIQTTDGQTFEFTYDKIEKMTKERKPNDEIAKQPRKIKPLGEENNEYVRIKYHRMIRAAMSFTPGTMPQHNMGNVYINGELEFYIASHLSLYSSSFYWIGTTTSKTVEEAILSQGGMGTVLKMNHQNYTGFHYHILKDKAFDPFIGFQPGFAVSQTNDNYYDDNIRQNGFVYAPPRHDTRISFNPMATIDLGFNFYAVKFFHLFVNGRYVMGQHLGGLKPYSLNEMMVSFGFGLNANFWNKRKLKH